ncbi:Alpha-1,3/1,6-mannosyltransferase ALG2 [Aphelenchoides bicaudatus]|nr:Alpha-1,3/1,6-mannosyltransferase ALG2 [Aphelenchoides bicaudatus]
MKIAILHPDLGIGGAERLVLDAALAYREDGHDVCIVTNQFSEDHCFADALKFKNDITVCAQWFPRSIFGRFYALCAYIRLCIAALFVIFNKDVDVIFMDSISLPFVVFWFFSFVTRPQRIFYCHFPDLLLTKRDSVAKKAYRLLVDNLERWSMSFADKIYVNSKFTKSICEDTFPALANSTQLNVLYPTLRTDSLDNAKSVSADIPDKFKYIFLSINRYEIKKNVLLAIQALDELRNLVERPVFDKCVLVVAGGYDPLNTENKIYYDLLVAAVEKFELESNVIFLKSPDDDKKVALIKACQMLIYTPKFEHFGIVPLEAMYLERCVLAVNAGGPTETVQNNKTGFLCEDTTTEFAAKMLKVIEEENFIRQLGLNGRQRVVDEFSFDAFKRHLNSDLL